VDYIKGGNKMTIFDRNELVAAVDFGQRATEMEKQRCWTEVAYYQQLAKKFNSATCVEHANQLFWRHTSL
jgi:hypothetical protein